MKIQVKNRVAAVIKLTAIATTKEAFKVIAMK